MKHVYRVGVAGVLLLLGLWVTTVVTAADATGRVSIQSTSVAAGVGVQWGDGTLTYNGKTYPFSLQGLEVVGLGYAEVKAEGTVSGLSKLEDFEGVYAAGDASAVAGSGTNSVTMTNPNGVTITLHSIQEGLKLALAARGVNIDLKG
jgi:hypothetical protein